MLQIGRKLSPATVLFLVRNGQFRTTFEDAVKTYGTNITVVQPVPKEVLQYIPDEEKKSLMDGLYVPSA